MFRTPEEIESRIRELAAGVPCPRCGPAARINLSMRSIARIVGVCKSTVFNVLNRKPRSTRKPKLAPRKTDAHRCPGCGGKIEFDECVKCAGLDWIKHNQPERLRVYA